AALTTDQLTGRRRTPLGHLGSRRVVLTRLLIGRLGHLRLRHRGLPRRLDKRRRMHQRARPWDVGLRHDYGLLPGSRALPVQERVTGAAELCAVSVALPALLANDHEIATTSILTRTCAGTASTTAACSRL